MILGFLTREGNSPTRWNDWKYISPSLQSVILDAYGGQISRKEFFKPEVARTIKNGIKALIESGSPSVELLESLAQSILLGKIIERGGSSFTPGDGVFLYEHVGYDCLELCRDFQRELEGVASHRPKHIERVNFTYPAGDNGSSQNMVHIDFGERNHYLIDVAAYLFRSDIMAKAFRGTDKNSVIKQGVNWLDGVYPGWKS